MIKRRWLIFCLVILSHFCDHAFCAPKLIKFVEIIFDLEQSPSLVASLNDYLRRFIDREADSEQRQFAEDFLHSVFWISTANCRYVDEHEGDRLACEVTSKRTIRDIIINNLPASLLESELKRRLPMEVGQTIDKEDLDSSLGVVKTRVETFLRKNGFYDGIVTTDKHLPVNKPVADIIVNISNGLFVRVNRVLVSGDSPIPNPAIVKLFRRMCFSFNKIIESISIGTLSCYSRELERDAIQNLHDRLAKLGYVQSQVRVSHYWIDSNDKMAPKDCQSSPHKKAAFRCIDLRVHIDKGPKVQWKVDVKDRLAIKRNAFQRFVASIFSVDQFSRFSTSDYSDEIALDHQIVEEELLKEVTFIPSKNVDEQELSESARLIKEFLINQGYANAEVFPSLIQEDEDNVLVYFEVYAGKPFFVKEVEITPAVYQPFIDKESLEQLVRVRSFTENGYLSHENIKFTKSEIAARLNSRGFKDVEITAIMESQNLGDVNVSFHIASKPREILDEIVVLNGYANINDEILPMLHNCDNFLPARRSDRIRKLCNGSSFVREKIEEDVTKIADFYQTNGFLYARVASNTVETKAGRQLVFTIFDSRFGEKSLQPLMRQQIKDIVISGNLSTSASVIKRLFPKQRRQTALDPISLKKGLANLRESGRFSRIDQKILAGQENSDDVYFLLQLAERKSLSLDTSIAFSTDQLFSLESELEEANLFSSMLKLNTMLGLGLFWGRQSIFNNKLEWPFILGKPLRLTVNAPIIVYDHLMHRPKPSRRVKSKIAFGLDWRLSPHITPHVKYSLVLTQENFDRDKSNFSDKMKSIDGLIPTLKKRGLLQGVLTPGITFIYLDNPFDPRSGIDTSLWTEISGGPFLGDTPFTNFGIRNRFFIPLGPLTIAMQATFMRAFIEPTEENWIELRSGSSYMDNLGGDRSIRGYEDGAIGIDSIHGKTDEYAGYFANIANIELRFPLSEKGIYGNFSGALFVDQGMLVPCSSLFGCTSTKLLFNRSNGADGFGLSVGGALRYSLPVGPISLDYGVSLITGKGRVHILFGYSF